MESLNSITKCILGAIIFTLIVVWVVNIPFVKHVNTATEFLDNYKNCVIVRKIRVQMTMYSLLKILILKILDIELLM